MGVDLAVDTTETPIRAELVERAAVELEHTTEQQPQEPQTQGAAGVEQIHR